KALEEKEAALKTARENEFQARAAQEDAQENLKDALAAVDQMTHVAEERLVFAPPLEPIRHDLLHKALAFYQRFLERQGDNPLITREAAFAYRRVGMIHLQLGRPQQAETAYCTAIGLFDGLPPASLDAPPFLVEIAEAHIEFSQVLTALGKDDEA